jgi:AP-3 complex subunit beta
VADVDPELSSHCMSGLVYLMACNKTPMVIEESLSTLRIMLMQNYSNETSLVVMKTLIKHILAEEGGIEVPSARSSIVWLVGEFREKLVDVAPDVLRLLAAGFTEESTETKTQIMNLAIKLSLFLPHDENVQIISTYVLEMTRYDLDTDLRDRSRFMTAMMGLAPSNENSEGENVPVDENLLAELADHADGILLPSKPAPGHQPPITVEGTFYFSSVCFYRLVSVFYENFRL